MKQFKLLTAMVAVLFVVSVQAGTITRVITNSVNGDIHTNTYTVAMSEIGVYPNGVGHTFGQPENHISFYGSTPVVQQSVGSAGTTTGSAAVTVSTGTSTWTPLYRTITVLDQNTNALTLIVCTNMPAVTAVTSATPGTVYGFTTSTQADYLTTLLNKLRTALRNLGLSD